MNDFIQGMNTMNRSLEIECFSCEQRLPWKIQKSTGVQKIEHPFVRKSFQYHLYSNSINIT